MGFPLVAPIKISVFFDAFSISLWAMAFSTVFFGFIKLIVLAINLDLLKSLLHITTFDPLSNKIKANFEPIFPAPIIVIFFPPKPLMSSLK